MIALILMEADDRALQSNSLRRQPGPSSSGRFLVRQPATRIRRVQHLNGIAARLNRVNLAFFVDDKSDAIRNGEFRNIYSIFLRNLTVDKITEKRKTQAKLACEGLLGRSVVRADSKNFCACVLEILHTSLVRFHFRGSAAGERRREECQDYSALANVVGNMHVAAVRRRQSKIRSLVTYF